MSQENVEVAREGFDAFKRGDLEQAFSMLSADVRLPRPLAEPPCVAIGKRPRNRDE
jgi:ketosteroid isomerase-like protein